MVIVCGGFLPSRYVNTTTLTFETMKKAILNRTIESIYLEYVNDWLTLSGMAEHYEIEVDELTAIINTAKAIRERYLDAINK